MRDDRSDVRAYEPVPVLVPRGPDRTGKALRAYVLIPLGAAIAAPFLFALVLLWPYSLAAAAVAIALFWRWARRPA